MLLLWHPRAFFRDVNVKGSLMPNPEWGVKRTCLSCAARFYDLGRDPIICPKCGAEFDLAALVPPVRGRGKKAEKAAPVKEAEAETTEDLVDDEDEGLDEAVEEIEDDDTAEDVVVADEDSDEDDELGEFNDELLLDAEEDAEDGIENLGDVSPEGEEET